MHVRIEPGSRLSGSVPVPGDKSIGHRWLMLAATASGPSRLVGVPGSLDVRSTARVMAALAPQAGPSLEAWASNGGPVAERSGSTWNVSSTDAVEPSLELEGEGWGGLVAPRPDHLDCGNSGTTMRLVSGIVAAAPLRAVLTGDPSLSRRPMERVADPLRAMGATIATTDGHPPVRIDGGELRGREYRPATPSAQVKSAVLLAGLRAEGTTTFIEPAPTRDHTERALAALGAPIEAADGTIRVSAYQHAGFEGRVPGDPSAAAFLIAAAALTGSELTLTGVGCNPTRLHFLDVMSRMGVRTTIALETTEVGEPVGTIHVEPADGIVATRVEPDELPLVIDEVPILAMLATAAPSDSWFLGAEELRVKESDRLKALTEGIRSLGGHAADEGDDLVVAGGGLAGGIAASEGDHRIGMAFAVAGLAARGPVEVREIEAADVSFPGFVPALAALGAHVEAVR